LIGKTAIGLRTVAAFEGAKGLIVLISGFGLAALMHHDAQHVVTALVHHLHLNPAKHYPQIFIDAAEQLSNVRLWVLAVAAGAYASLRLIEAYGLWNDRAWAEWLAAISGGIYIPFEIYELGRGFTVLRLVTFTCNVVIVAVMVWALMQRRAARPVESRIV
jgi:uncharacterized membrane protein (DUF2068 family)